MSAPMVLAGLALLVAAAAGKTPPSFDGTTPSADGVPIRYHVEGEGSPALVFVHCWTCSRQIWDAQVPRFAKDHRVVTLDLAGHGESGRGRKEWTIAAYGDDVAAVVRALDLKSVVLIGHSMGGPVILEAARRLSDRVIGLVPVDTLTDVERPAKPEEVQSFLAPFRADFKAAATTFIRQVMFVPASDPRLIERVVAATAAAPPEVAIGSLANAISYDAAAALLEIKAPIHGVNGDKFPTNVEANRRHARSYDVTIMKGVGHYLMLEDPERFSRLLAGAIEALQRPSAR